LQKSYLGKTKLCHYSKVKDPKNPPVNRGFNTDCKLNNSHEQKTPKLTLGENLQFHEFVQFLDSNTELAAPKTHNTHMQVEKSGSKIMAERDHEIGRKRKIRVFLTFS
jgi:hypothetical protein